MVRKKSQPDALKLILTTDSMLELAGNRYYWRGNEYFEDGAVTSLKESGGVITGKVQGTRLYKVQIWVEDGELDHECSCPLGEDAQFCKHCVAVGLAWLSKDKPTPLAESGKKADDTIGEQDVRDFLMGKSKEALVEMLLEQCEEDERLNRRLLAMTARTGRDKLDLSVWKNALEEAASSDDFVDWRGMHDYSSGIHEVVDSVGELLHEGHAEAVIEIIEHGFAVMERAMEYVDDSSGGMSMLMEQMQELHLKACQKAMPEPVHLAERLFAWELRLDWDTFFHAAETYADVLGERGLAWYQKRTEEMWCTIKPLGPGERDPDGYKGKRLRITSMMESLAKASGDIDALVVVKSKDLSHPHNFLMIAEIYQKAGQEDRALEWAERGWNAFPEKGRDARLREFIAYAYHRRGRHDEAMAMTWAAFTERLSFDMYKTLADHAKLAKTWPTWRDKALAHIREQLAASKRQQTDRRRWDYDSLNDHSILVQAFLWEEDMDAAWNEARAGGCSGSLWLELAGLREKTDPYNSVQIYREHIRHLLKHADNRNYEESVEYLARIKKLLGSMSKLEDFPSIVAEVRNEHRRKRNLMALLDRKKW
ncbi:MAG: SWIM zinc finger family protein [Magnetococcales bacterium]|nr:SWIM zinc finger family protein [Magnetococcales bacterium]